MMIVLPMEVLRDRLVEILNRFERKKTDSADYTIKGKFYFEVPVAGDKTYVVNQTRRLPAFRLLKVETEDLHIDKFGFKNSDLSMSLIIKNPNIFEVSIRDVDYDLTIGKDFRLEGDVKNTTTIPPRSKVKVPLKMDVHTKNFTRFAWQALFEKKHTPFHIHLRCKMVSTDDTFKDLVLTATRDGRLDELKKAKPGPQTDK
jgi:LEA14-like dessication related protein